MCLPGAAITLKDDEVQQSNFGDFVVPRITDIPKIAVPVVHSAEPPTGMGKPGVQPLAPRLRQCHRATDRQAVAALQPGLTGTGRRPYS